jgi:epoxyqueuosine reductase QueG
MKADAKSPPHFHWEEWYQLMGGRENRDPAAEALLHEIYHGQFPRFEGEVAAERQSLGRPAEAAALLKAKAREFGAEIVGICEIEPTDIYRGRSMPEKYAVAVGMRMDYTAFKQVPSPASGLECIRIYHALGEVVIRLAEYIRSLGWTAEIEHPIGDSNLLHIPIGLKAGFGELGRHGSIIHPELGPLFRMGSVACSIPLATDGPVDAGIAAFCDSCNACRIYCPADAIPDKRSPEAGKDHLGNDRYIVDTAKCIPFFNRHHYCSANHT